MYIYVYMYELIYVIKETEKFQNLWAANCRPKTADVVPVQRPIGLRTKKSRY